MAILVGTALGALFVLRQGMLTNPLMDLRVFRNKSFSAALVIQLVVGITQGGNFFLLVLYLQTVEGLSPLRAGLWVVPGSVAMITAIMLSSAAVRRIRPAYIIAIGLAISVDGYVLWTQVGATSGLGLLIPGIVLISFGVGPALALSTDLVVGSVAPEKAGSAASISESSSELGLALGVAVFGSILTAIYRNQLTDKLGAVPAGAADTARESIVGAVSAAQQLPATLGTQVLVPAREAFTTGLNVAAVIMIACTVGLAVLAATVLRSVRPSGEAAVDQADGTSANPTGAEDEPDEMARAATG
jgi:DHA2 family multidrug resistance protein-like MFS transporter